VQRVEKYRPDTLEDVSGHQDILATVNRFVETNVSIRDNSVVTCANLISRDYLTYSFTAHQELEKHPRS
jgi:hypothetical protein